MLLSHSSFRHVGSLAYLRRWCGLRCPVYTTLPIHSMGAMTMYDVYQQEVQGIRRRRAAAAAAAGGVVGEDEELFTLDDVDAVFDSMKTLKYSEEFPLPPKLAAAAEPSAALGAAVGGGGSRLRISPHQSGHSVGGAVWRILRESDVLLYAVDYNHVKSLLHCVAPSTTTHPLPPPPPPPLTCSRSVRDVGSAQEAEVAVQSFYLRECLRTPLCC